MPRKNAHVTVETTATTSPGVSAFGVHTIVYIVNDGSVDIVFNFDALTTEAGAFTLKPGETLNNVSRECNQIHYKTGSGSAAFRVFGLR